MLPSKTFLNRILFLFSICIFLFATLNGQAQNTISIKGRITNEEGKPAPFINAILMKSVDSSLVKAAITDEEGNYKLDLVPPGNYRVMATTVGSNKIYSPGITVKGDEETITLNQLILPAKPIDLKEVQVTALRPFVEHKIDKTVVNVENSIVNAGATALEVLQQSPGIMVDNHGHISMQGKQGVLVTIDDKPTYLSEQDLYNMLRNMPSDQLSQLELITNPSAKYDAAGNSGIINIKMRKKQNLGFNGSARISYGQGAYPDIGTGMSLNYRNEKYNIFGSYDYTYGYYYTTTELIRRFNFDNSISQFNLNIFDKGYYITHNFRGGMDYFINKKQTIGMLLKGNSYNNHDENSNTTEIFNNNNAEADSGYTAVNVSDTKWSNISGNINYRYDIDSSGTVLSADLDFAKYDNKADFNFETDYYSTFTPTYKVITTALQPAQIDIRSFKIDFTRPISKQFKLEAGIKTSVVETDNDVKHFNIIDDVSVPDTGKTNHFIYSENINAAYSTLHAEFKKIGIQLGLRAEQTISEGNQVTTDAKFNRDYIDLFPSAFFTYTFSDKNQSRISYSRRIDRPGYQQLNPFKYYIDPYNYEEGNPLLQPQYTNSFQIGHTYMQMFTLAIRYSHTTKAITQIAKQIDSTHTTFVINENLGTRDQYGISFNAPVTITKWWNLSNNIDVFNNSVEGMSSGGMIDNKLTSFTVNIYNSISLPKNWAVELSGEYYSKVYYGTMLVDPRFTVSAGVRKTFFKDRLTLRANINDIFHTDVTDSKIQYQNINVDYFSVYDSQFVRFHLMYNFGKKTVARARQRSTGTDEEENRINRDR